MKEKDLGFPLSKWSVAKHEKAVRVRSMKPIFHMKENRVDCRDRMAVIQSVLMTTIYRHVIKRVGEQN